MFLEALIYLIKLIIFMLEKKNIINEYLPIT